MSTIEVYRDWCELVLGAFNNFGYSRTLTDLIKERAVPTLANYLMSRRDDLPLKDCKTCRKKGTESCRTCNQNGYFTNRWEKK